MCGKKKLVGLAVGILGVAAAVAGFLAEAYRVEKTDVRLIESNATCVYPSSPSRALGIAASAILLTTQIINTVATLYVCGKSEDCHDVVVQCYFWAISWLFSGPAFVYFMLATFHHYESKNAVLLKGNKYTCYVVKPRMFSTASALTLAFSLTSAVILGAYI